MNSSISKEVQNNFIDENESNLFGQRDMELFNCMKSLALEKGKNSFFSLQCLILFMDNIIRVHD